MKLIIALISGIIFLVIMLSALVLAILLEMSLEIPNWIIWLFVVILISNIVKDLWEWYENMKKISRIIDEHGYTLEALLDLFNTKELITRIEILNEIEKNRLH